MTRASHPTPAGPLPGRPGPAPPPGPAEPSPEHLSAQTRSSTQPGRHRVLVVDDDRDTLLSLKHYLEAHLPDTDVVTSRSPLDALDVVDQSDVRVVITDLRMPGMDGLEFWRRAREYRHDLVGMLITANADIELKQTAEREGLTACLSKPFDLRRLRTTLTHMMETADKNADSS